MADEKKQEEKFSREFVKWAIRETLKGSGVLNAFGPPDKAQLRFNFPNGIEGVANGSTVASEDDAAEKVLASLANLYRR